MLITLVRVKTVKVKLYQDTVETIPVLALLGNSG